MLDVIQAAPSVEAAIKKYGGSLQAADRDDLRQLCYLQLLQAEDVDLSRLRAFAYVVAANRCRDYLRTYYCRRRKFLSSEAMTDVPARDDPPAVRWTAQQWRAVLDRLDPKTRRVVVLRVFSALRLKDIAQITGDHLSNVKRRWLNAVREIAQTLGTMRELGAPDEWYADAKPKWERLPCPS